MPNSLLLENESGSLLFVVSALSSPFRTEKDGGVGVLGSKESKLGLKNHSFPCGAVFEYHRREWVQNALHVGHYVLPVHMSRLFLFTPTLGSALYLLMIRFFQRDYRSVFQLAPSIVSDSKLDPNEAQILEHLEYLASDMHPDAHACRIKLSLVLLSSAEYINVPGS